jgi:hypothetical protein
MELSYVFVVTIFICFYSIPNYKKRFIRPRFAFRGLVVIALIEAAVAVAPRQGSLPIALAGPAYGCDNLRLPSLTGSYLHYPLFVGIVASLCRADEHQRASAAGFRHQRIRLRIQDGSQQPDWKCGEERCARRQFRRHSLQQNRHCSERAVFRVVFCFFDVRTTAPCRLLSNHSSGSA